VSSEYCEVGELLVAHGYRLDRVLASGAFGVVWKALRDADDGEVALKIVDVRRLNESETEQMEEEVQILRSVRHGNIVELYDVMRTENFVVLVMEYLPGGDLFDRLDTVTTESTVVEIAEQILSALLYLHQRGIAHRDIKLENIVFLSLPSEKEIVVKLVDFGFARYFGPYSQSSQFCGSMHYISPQQVRRQKYTPFKADMWGLGVVLYAMVSRTFPFDGDTEVSVSHSITHRSPSFHEPQWGSYSEFASTVALLLSKSESDRPSAFVARHRLEQLRSRTERPESESFSSKKSTLERLRYSLGFLPQTVM